MRYRHYKEDFVPVRVDGCSKKQSDSFKLITAEWTDHSGWPHSVLRARESREIWFNCEEFVGFVEDKWPEIAKMLLEEGLLDNTVWLPTLEGSQLPLEGSACAKCKFFRPNQENG